MGNDTTFGERLQKLRIARGYKSQKAFADAIGLAYQTINYYECGKRKPDIEVFQKIADFFEIPYDYFLSDSKATKSENKEITDKIGLNNVTIGRLYRLNQEAQTDEDARIKLAFINQLFSCWDAEELLNSFIMKTAINTLHQQKMDKLGDNPIHIGDKKSADRFLALQNISFSPHFTDICVERFKRMLNPDQRFMTLFDGIDILKFLLPVFVEQKETYRKWSEMYKTLEEEVKEEEGIPNDK